MNLFQEGFPVDAKPDEAIAAATANAQRHYPNATIAKAEVVQAPPEYVAAGLLLVEVHLDGDLTAADLTDPAVVKAAQLANALAVVAVLDTEQRAAVAAELAKPVDPVEGVLDVG